MFNNITIINIVSFYHLETFEECHQILTSTDLPRFFVPAHVRGFSTLAVAFTGVQNA
jgi:hypothetical protein